MAKTEPSALENGTVNLENDTPNLDDPNIDGQSLVKQLSGEISSDVVTTEMAKRLLELREKAQIKGFRPGKVPLSLIKTRYGKSVFAEFLDEQVKKSTEQLVKDEGYVLAIEPTIKLVNEENIEQIYEGEQPIKFSMDCEIMPIIELPEITELKFVRPVADVSDELVNEEITKLAKQHLNYNSVDRASKTGDRIKLDFAGFLDGEAVANTDATDFFLDLGDGKMIPGFEENLLGTKKGDKPEFDVTFPTDYHEASLAAKQVLFKTEIKDVLESEDAKLDDDLAKKIGAKDLEELKTRVKDHIGNTYSNMSRAKLKLSILNELDGRSKFAVPPTLQSNEFDSIWQQLTSDMARDKESFDAEQNEEEKTKRDYLQLANRRVRLALMINKIGSTTNLSVSQDELKNAIIEQARRYPGQEQQIFDYYTKTPSAVGQLQGPLYEEKIIDYIIELAEVTDEKVDRDILFTTDDESDDDAAASKTTSPKKSKAKKPSSEKTKAKVDEKVESQIKSKVESEVKTKPTADTKADKQPKASSDAKKATTSTKD